MFDNYTHFDSIIRTCSSVGCDSTTMDQFDTCVRQPKKYMISGCVLKSCCKDRDLCNSANRNFFSGSFLCIYLFHIMIPFYIVSQFLKSSVT